MVDATVVEKENAEAEDFARIYEVGYVITPSVKEENIEKIIASVRSEIEKAGGSFIAEGAPSLTRLAYTMSTKEGGKRIDHDKGYFGWIKFEASVATAQALEGSLKGNSDIMRCMIFRTVREDTRAKMKAPTLREVKRTDTIKSTPRRAEEDKGPVSEADLEKAIQDITTE